MNKIDNANIKYVTTQNGLKKNVLEWLQTSQKTSEILSKANLYLSIQKTLQNILPTTLSNFVRISHVNQDELLILVPNSAYAAKIRQLSPRILDVLIKSGWKIIAIHVLVKQNLLNFEQSFEQKSDQLKKNRVFDKTVYDELEKLANCLESNPPLVNAINQFLSNYKKHTNL